MRKIIRRHPEPPIPSYPIVEGSNEGWNVNIRGFVEKDVWKRFLYSAYCVFQGTLLHVGKDAGIFDNVEIPQTGGEGLGPIRVEDCAVVYEKANLHGYIKIYGTAKVYGKATIGPGESESKLTQIYHNAEVYDNAKVDECAEVFGNSKIYGNAHICGHAKVTGEAEVSGNTKIYGNVEISGIVRISGDTEICGKLKISGDVKIGGGIYFSEKEIEVKSKEEWARLSPSFKCKDKEELKRRKNRPESINPLAELE